MFCKIYCLYINLSNICCLLVSSFNHLFRQRLQFLDVLGLRVRRFPVQVQQIERVQRPDLFVLGQSDPVLELRPLDQAEVKSGVQVLAQSDSVGDGIVAGLGMGKVGGFDEGASFKGAEFLWRSNPG